MSSSIESTIKALVEFESDLDRAKAQAEEAKKRLIRGATEWAASARERAMADAQRIAGEQVARARAEAEAEAESIREKGQASLKAFEAAISKHKTKAVELVNARLLGDLQ